jgi:hypothetical protein
MRQLRTLPIAARLSAWMVRRMPEVASCHRGHGATAALPASRHAANETKNQRGELPAFQGEGMKPKPNIFPTLCLSQGLPAPEAEHRFAAPRRWRFDFAWPAYRVALEVEGGVWTGGRHTSGAGFVRDMEKYNAAGGLGWIVLRCMPKTLCTMATINTIKAAIEVAGKQA